MLTNALAAQHHFSNCTAAFLNDKLIVSEYTPEAKPKIAATARGRMTVATADISPERTIPVENVKFMLAIRDGKTKTIMMFSSKTFRQLPIESVLAKCKKGDYIVVMTLSDEYYLPHNEILVE